MAQLLACRLTDCDLSNAEWELCRLEDTVFERCRLTGFRLSECSGLNVAFRDCQGRYLQLDRCKIEDGRFETCQLNESTMMGCELPRAVFTGCDLAGAVLSGSRLRGADLRGCAIGGIRASLDDLAGTVLDPEQAAAVLMGEVGIRVVPVGVELARAVAGRALLPRSTECGPVCQANTRLRSAGARCEARAVCTCRTPHP